LRREEKEIVLTVKDYQKQQTEKIAKLGKDPESVSTKTKI